MQAHHFIITYVIIHFYHFSNTTKYFGIIVSGRSNAINVAERLGLSNHILDKARKLHGTSGAEINEVSF